METKKTSLYEHHIGMKAKMAPFAGYYMPISYAGITEEHTNVRENVGVFDVSHMGEFIVEGKNALAFVQSISSNDAERLNVGDAQYSCLPNDKGGIVDDFILYRMDDSDLEDGANRFMMVVNASNIEKDWNWINQFLPEETSLVNRSADYGILAVQGPKATDLLSLLCDEKLEEIAFYSFIVGEVAGVKDVIISATGYTGAGGFELYAMNEDLPKLWEAIFATSEKTGVMPAGLGARDTLRLEMGYCLYGNDLNDTTSPLEAGLGWITKLNKKSLFPSKDFFIHQKEKGLEKSLVGFIMEDKRIPRKGYPILDPEGRVIGEVTSGTHSPSLDVPVGMGYVQKAHAVPQTNIQIDFGRKSQMARLIKLPFYKKPE